jgi:hypothetical protein
MNVSRNLKSHVSSLADAAILAFAERAGRALGREDVLVMEESTEEIHHNLRAGKALFAKGLRGRLTQKGAGGPNVSRLEENYLYSTRRFPTATNNTIGSGALTVNAFPFFTKANGDEGSSLGFPTGFTLSQQETNMEIAGQIPQGTSFVFNQIGISFNSDITVGDCNQLLDAATLQFAKAGGQFTLNHGPVKMWPGGMGNGGFAATTATTTTIQHGSNGQPDIRAVRNLRIARVLKEKETFSYNLVIARTTKATDGTAWALSNFALVTIWLWGGQKNLIPA